MKLSFYVFDPYISYLNFTKNADIPSITTADVAVVVCCRYIVFHVIDKDNNSSNDSLGQCIVELKHLNPELGLHGNYELSDLVKTPRSFILISLYFKV